jgi:hypothetical protein
MDESKPDGAEMRAELVGGRGGGVDGDDYANGTEN